MDGTVISNILKVDYGYHNIDRTKTTARIGTMTYTRPASSIKPVPALAYSYDAVGNITKVVSGTDTLAEYTYDNQNQLVSEDDGQYLTTYTYDTYGNIRSIWVRDSETYSAVLETYEFSYADDRDWKDQLTGVTYTDYNSDGKGSASCDFTTAMLVILKQSPKVTVANAFTFLSGLFTAFSLIE